MLYHINGKSRKNLLTSESARRTTSPRAEALPESSGPMKGTHHDVEPNRHANSTSYTRYQQTLAEIVDRCEEGLGIAYFPKPRRRQLGGQKFSINGAPFSPSSRCAASSASRRTYVVPLIPAGRVGRWCCGH